MAEQPTDTSKLTFEQKVALPIAALLQDLFQEVPELRSVCVVMDWQGDLNKGTQPCMWFDKHGPLSKARGDGDAITGSMSQLIRTFLQQTEVGLNLIGAYSAAIQEKQALLQQVEGRLNEQAQRLEQLAESGQEGSPGVGQEPGDDPG